MNRSSQYDWDRHKGHIAAHQIEPHEFEEVLANEPVYIETRIDTESGEERILELGHTNRGRVIFVAWTIRGARTRPVTAFEANRKTRAEYERRRYEENSSKAIDAEAAFAEDLYRDRAALNSKAQELLATGSRQVTIRLSNSELARAKQQAEAKGLRYQTYIKMLLHEALAQNSTGR